MWSDSSRGNDALMRTGTPDGMAQIPGGTFRMGSDVHYPEERPAHSVTVDDFGSTATPSPMPTSPRSSLRPAMSRLPSGHSTRRSIPVHARSC
jgi:hypothetical protein